MNIFLPILVSLLLINLLTTYGGSSINKIDKFIDYLKPLKGKF